MAATDQPSDKPPAAALQSAPPAGATARQRSRTLRLGLFLSALLLLSALGYLTLAPTPVPRDAQSPAAPAPASPPVAATGERALRFIAPRTLVSPDLLKDFEAETGATVDLVLFDNEESVTRVAVVGADVVLASGPTLQALNGALGVLPARLIGNLGRVDPALRSLANTYDKGGLHAVPFAWTTYGLGLNREAAAAHLGPAAPIDTWALLFDPASSGKLKPCGLVSLSAPSIAFPTALLFLGAAHTSDAPADTERASALWEAARPAIASFDSRAVEEGLATGRTCAALASAGEVDSAKVAARSAGQPFNIEFVVPREGALMRLYLLALTRGSADGARGAALIDYLLRPEVSARMTNARHVANAIPAAQLYVRQDVREDATIYPDTAAFARLTPEQRPSPAIAGLRERFWQLISAPPAP